MAQVLESRPLPLTSDPGIPDMLSPARGDLVFDLPPSTYRGGIIANPRTINRAPVIPPEQARQAFVSWVEQREAYFGHEPFCGARAQFILDGEFNPIQVNGYTAARWMAGGGSTVLGKTEWGSGWQVVTALNQYHGCFLTEIMASDYAVNGDHVATNTPKDALAAHREAVELVMKLSKFHGREASPSKDDQVLLEPVGAR